ncbi:AAC-rich mRNA clone AAC4 protein-like [Ruditapes philippinarum]|uniref:AAC-rich mRNA clone AAC4 protein-like n=1 Tax=Ruditapes philippinarum TaxID=129788 RepID=UPI00295B1DF1|nr:AAC-rich mRNA clone AAC4 protein-like [Ruditapes philippinarum]
MIIAKRKKQKKNYIRKQSLLCYFGERFNVCFFESCFIFRSLIIKESIGGVILSDFTTNRKEEDLDLSSIIISESDSDIIKIRDAPNAGGSSIYSEVLSFLILKKCCHAKLLKTEMEIEYFPRGGPITDYVCQIYGTILGVSVSRAMKFGSRAYTEEDAKRLLHKKLKGVIKSTNNNQEKWKKQVLHLWSVSNDVTSTLIKVFNMIPPEIKSNTVILITTTVKTFNLIYLNK